MKQVCDLQNQVVQFWLTQAEQQDAAVLEQLQQEWDSWHKSGYRVVVFRSGGRDLLPLTQNLLLHNRTGIVQPALKTDSNAVSAGNAV